MDTTLRAWHRATQATVEMWRRWGIVVWRALSFGGTLRELVGRLNWVIGYLGAERLGKSKMITFSAITVLAAFHPYLWAYLVGLLARFSEGSEVVSGVSVGGVLVAMFCATMMENFFRVVAYHRGFQLEQGVRRQLDLVVVSKVVQLDIAQIDSARVTRLLSRLGLSVEYAGELVTKSHEMLDGLIGLVVGVVVLTLAGYWWTILLLMLGMVFYLRGEESFAQSDYVVEKECEADLQLQDSLLDAATSRDSLREFRAFGSVAELGKRANALYSKVVDRRLEFIDTYAKQQYRSFIPRALSVALTFGIGWWQFRIGQFNLGILYWLVVASVEFQEGFEKVILSFAEIRKGWEYLSDLRHFLTLQGEIEDLEKGGARVTGGVPTIEFREVTFQYPTATEPALVNVSFAIQPGEKVRLAGGNSSGKSTVAQLLTGEWQPNRGEILISGISLSSLDLREWRRRIAVLSSETTMVPGLTLRENLWLGIPSDAERPSDEEILKVLELVQVAPILSRMRVGLESVYGQSFNGFKLSDGARAMLGIARALLRYPYLIVIDETLSKVDSAKRRVILDHLMSLEGVSMLFVSHVDVEGSERVIHLKDGVLTLDRPRVSEGLGTGQVETRSDAVT